MFAGNQASQLVISKTLEIKQHRNGIGELDHVAENTN
ncbi:hypothetical protein OIU78_007984 [Salix suchowensis]|nr:hypothetical protein OIU78_007984 [Salix suchowensis]